MLYLFFMLCAAVLCVLCTRKAAYLDFIELFQLRDTLYILELQNLAGKLSSHRELDKARLAVVQTNQKRILFYALGFLSLFLILLLVLLFLIREL